MTLGLAIGIIVAIVFVLLYTLRRQQDKKDVYVIRELRAKAVEAEQRRKTKGDVGESPMQDQKYDFWRGELNLINPVQNHLDTMIGELCKRFASSDAQARASIRASIRLEELYTLLTFSRRAAVVAIRQQSVDWVNNGLTAISIIEYERADFRDILLALSLLYNSATRIGENADQLLRYVATLSEPEMAKLIIEFMERTEKGKDLRSSWGYEEVETKDGVGLIGWDFKSYNPTYDLKKIAIETGDLIATDKYQPQSISVASELPPYWLVSYRDYTSAEKVPLIFRAGASIWARLRPNEHPKHDSQMLMVYFEEGADENTARALLEMSKKKGPPDYCMKGFVKGRLFCLLVAKSEEMGVKSFETPKSVERFSEGISEIMRRYVKD